MRRRRSIGAILMLHSISGLATNLDASNAHFSPDGYRISYYRSATPLEVQGGTTLTTEELSLQLLKHPETRLIDVQPVTWRNGIFIYDTPRQTLPNSIWLPNVGWGELEDHWIEYFAKHLFELSQGNRNHPIALFCTADCWMSWNAVKRAHSWGYTQLLWYAEGSDGWLEAGYALKEAHPEPLAVDALLYATGEVP